MNLKEKMFIRAPKETDSIQISSAQYSAMQAPYIQ